MSYCKCPNCRTKQCPASHPVIIIGWPTVARLAHGEEVHLKDVSLLPDDLFFNEARRIRERKPGKPGKITP